MDRELLRKELLRLLENETGVPRAELPDHLGLREDLGLDSVDLVSLVMQVECQFRVRLAAEELTALKTVGDLLTLMQAKLAPASAAA
ncbi:MAG: acyl carrier protein [Gemmataceae bacterium]|nr:acyl carrier protein [Gemmataceae bacterium]